MIRDAAATTLPALAVLGASFSYGTGAESPAQAWPQVLAAALGLRAVVAAEPGAGYLAVGAHGRGPMARLLPELGLARLRPALVIVQSGHNDIDQPEPMLRVAVERLIGQIQAESPGAAIGVLTVFPTGDHPAKSVWDTDAAIVAAARAADPQVSVFDPLAAGWHFPRLADGLHPTAAGHRWIAEQLAEQIRADGLLSNTEPARPVTAADKLATQSHTDRPTHPIHS
ncbi:MULTISPECIES: SGNH/GDSL hydrolase family protein [unclassified Nocardia]|uniref:SGNH/GDSL hydrolase family protein n=1 Tax=unclassified Nocardia TaxID=2637762 RepID=UPI001CE3C158|nr:MULTISPECIES: SGNH/GDSL hydrolase family protein [unclassified Nocardia]